MTSELRFSTSVKSINLQLVTLLRVPGTTSHTSVAQSRFDLQGIEHRPLGKQTDAASNPVQRALRHNKNNEKNGSNIEVWYVLGGAISDVDCPNTRLEVIDDVQTIADSLTNNVLLKHLHTIQTLAAPLLF